MDHSNIIAETSVSMSPAELAVLASSGRWQHARHLGAINQALLTLAGPGPRRLIIALPPRHGKSEFIGRYFPAWYLGNHPDRQIMYTSYESRQARRYGRMARDVFAQVGPELFGLSVSRRVAAADMWSVAGHEGGMMTAGVGGPLTGKGAHVLIVDDPTKNSAESESGYMRERIWDWWESTALTRLEPNAGVILIQTRWHIDDLVGRVLARQAAENWHEIRLPALAEAHDPLGRGAGEALWPERFDAAELARVRDNRALYWWLAMYQQRPGRARDAEWPDEYFDGQGFWFDEWPDVPLRVMALDPSQGRSEKSDYSAFALVGQDDDGHLWIDANLARRPVGQMVSDGVELCRTFRPALWGIESNAWQNLLCAQVEEELLAARLFDVQTYEITNRADKHLRIRRLDRWLRARAMHFRNTPGSRLLVSQLRDFPCTNEDDGPDALEMAMRLLDLLRGIEPDEGAPRIVRVRA